MAGRRPQSGGLLATEKHQTRGRRVGRPTPGGGLNVGREAIITRACDLLTRMRPSQVTRAALAREAGVDPSLIRYYFRNRSTLLLGAVERLTAQFLAMVEKDSPSAAPDELLTARVKSLLRLTFNNPNFHQLIVDEVASMHTPAARALLRGLTDRGLSAYGSIVQSGAADGSMRAVDPRFLFIAIIGMTHFFVSGAPIVRLVVGEGGDDEVLVERYGEFLCDLLLRGLAPRKGAATSSAR